MTQQNSDVIQKLTTVLWNLSGNPAASHARIRAALLAALAEGADINNIADMAHAVGLDKAEGIRQ